MSEILKVENPYTGEVIDTLTLATPKDFEVILKIAEQGRKIARDMPRHQRATILNKTADIIENKADHFAQLITMEAGKTITQAKKEVSRCQNTLRLSAQEASRNAGEVIPFDSYEGSENRVGYFTREPLGIIAAITPFNDPLNLVAHKVGPAIAGGNSVILKPSSLTPLSALELIKAFCEAGLPEEVLSSLICNRTTGQLLIKEKLIRMISFTGGMETGEAITRMAGLKKITMDLGVMHLLLLCPIAI